MFYHMTTPLYRREKVNQPYHREFLNSFAVESKSKGYSVNHYGHCAVYVQNDIKGRLW